MPFDHLGLSADLLRAVADEGYTTPTPVQEQAIPLVLQGRDLLAAAREVAEQGTVGYIEASIDGRELSAFLEG